MTTTNLPWGTPVDDPSLVGPPVDLPTRASAAVDPELASALTQSALDEPKPTIEALPDTVVELPGGYIDPQGRLHSTAVVRELTGADEERISKVDPVANLPLWLNSLLKNVETIGDVQPTTEVLSALLIGDREALILGIRRATYGNGISVQVVCPNCGEEEDVIIEIDKDIPFKRMEDPEQRVFEVKLRDGDIAEVRLATVGVQDEILAAKKKTLAEITTLTLERCVLRINGNPAVHQTVLDLGSADRRTLATFLADNQPGPDYRGVKLPCRACGKEFPLTLDLADLFRG